MVSDNVIPTREEHLRIANYLKSNFCKWLKDKYGENQETSEVIEIVLQLPGMFKKRHEDIKVSKGRSTVTRRIARVKKLLTEFSSYKNINPEIQIFSFYISEKSSRIQIKLFLACSESHERYSNTAVRIVPLDEAIKSSRAVNRHAYDADYSMGYLSKTFLEIDQLLLSLIRDHRHTSSKVITHEYNTLLKSGLEEKGVSLDVFQRRICDIDFRSNFISQLPEPRLIITVNDDLSSMTFSCPPAGELVIDNPTLLWDCHCVTPNSKFGKDCCPIHSSPLHEEIESRFLNWDVLIKHRGLDFHWRSRRELWPPSIDSFHMLQVLEADGLFTENYDSVLDLGSGTGFLGITAAIHNPNITQLTLSDWLLTPYLYSTINWYLNSNGHENVDCCANIDIFTGNLDMRARPFDVVLCNPPYLPLLNGFDKLGLESTVSGTDLLVNIIKQYESLGKKVYIQFSHLALPEAKAAVDKIGIVLKPVGNKRLVPFRLRRLERNPDYLSALINERGMTVNMEHRHPYWHEIQAYALES